MVREVPPGLSSKSRCPRMLAGNTDEVLTGCRYVIYELEYQTSDLRTECKIVFLLYCPDCCSTSDKFATAITKDEVKKKLINTVKEIQVNDWADLDEENCIRYFRK